MTDTDGCPTCDTLQHWLDYRLWWHDGDEIWKRWGDGGEEEPPEAEAHWQNRPRAPHLWMEGLAEDEQDFLWFSRAVLNMTCTRHGGHGVTYVETPTVHIPGLGAGGRVRPACGADGVMSLEVYHLGGDLEGKGIPIEESMHPHVTCDECGNAQANHHLARDPLCPPLRWADASLVRRWQRWLRSPRTQEPDDGCTFMVRVS